MCTALGGQLVSAGSRTLAGLELDASLHTTQLTFANAQSSFFLTFPTVSGWRQTEFGVKGKEGVAQNLDWGRLSWGALKGGGQLERLWAGLCSGSSVGLPGSPVF